MLNDSINYEMPYYNEIELNISDYNFRVIWHRGFNNKTEDVIVSDLMHSHEYYEVFLVLSGKLDIITAQGKYNVPENHMILIPPNVIHNTFNSDPNTIRMAIGVYVHRRVNGLTDSRKNIELLPDMQSIGSPIDFSADRYLAEKLNTLFNNSGLFYHELASMYFVVLMFTYLSYFNKQNIDITAEVIEKQSKDYREHEISTFINEHYCEPISLREMAKRIFTSEQHINRILKRKYNQTFNQRITFLRMTKAAKLLLKEKMSIMQIAHSIGYSSMYNFYKVFRRFYGCTPSEYRLSKINHDTE